MHLAHYLKQILILFSAAYTVDELSWDSAEKQIKQSDRKGKKQAAKGGFTEFESRKIETDLIVFMPLNVTAGQGLLLKHELVPAFNPTKLISAP